MSHIAEIKTQIKNPRAIGAACARLNLPAPAHGTEKLYMTSASGQIVKLPGWRYPIVINTDTGTIQYDNYEGCWGDPKHLDRFRQTYAIEAARIEATRKGHRFAELPQPDGSVKIEITTR